MSNFNTILIIMVEGKKDRIVRYNKEKSKEPISLEKQIFENKERRREFELRKRKQKFLPRR